MDAYPIVAEGLKKHYRVRMASSEVTLRETIYGAFRRVFSHVRSPGSGGDGNVIRALEGVSFNVDAGEVFGIIGKNGSGKSTLLRIMAQITRPTAGRVTIRGRVGYLLELGSGFHPELTGRDNVFLSGTILGMKRAEVAQRMDDIVAFAEMARFLDIPVKKYSSGMYVRLAFSVAVHLDVDVLLVDEVLAVGDYNFQKKCFKKLTDMIAQGKTILFVSHDHERVKQLCDRAMWLDSGNVKDIGEADMVVDRYLDYCNANGPAGG